MTKKIYCFSGMADGGDGIAYAMAEDGTVLGSHWCSNEYYIHHDLGVSTGSRPDRHVTYAEHFPEGYEMEFVAAKDIDDHEGLKVAFALNAAQAKVAEKSAEDPA